MNKRYYGLALISAGIFAAVFFDLLSELVRQWAADPEYFHGFFIPAVSAYFFWKSRKEFKAEVSLQGYAPGLSVMVVGAALYILATIAYQFYIKCVAMLLVLFGLFTVLFGPKAAKRAAFPIFFMLLMIPLPQLIYENVTFKMRLFSTEAAYAVLKIFGMSITREGSMLYLPNTSLEVGVPCSGIRGLMTYTVVSLAFGYLFQKTTARRSILFAFGIFLSVLMNVTRLVVLAGIVYVMGVKVLPVSIHDAEGTVFTVLGLLILLMFSDWLSRVKKDV